MAKTVGMISLGCPKNQVDAEIMLKKLVDAGYILVDEAEKADVVIVNTCAFIEDSKKESIDSILEMIDYKEDGLLKKVVVTGCMAQRYADEIFSEIPEVDAVIGIGANDDIVKACDSVLDGEQYSSFPNKEEMPLEGAAYRLFATCAILPPSGVSLTNKGMLIAFLTAATISVATSAF